MSSETTPRPMYQDEQIRERFGEDVYKRFMRQRLRWNLETDTDLDIQSMLSTWRNLALSEVENNLQNGAGDTLVSLLHRLEGIADSPELVTERQRTHTVRRWTPRSAK